MTVVVPRVPDRWEYPAAEPAEGSGSPAAGPFGRAARLLRLAPGQARSLAYLLGAAALGIALMSLPELYRSPAGPGSTPSGSGPGAPRAMPAAALNPPVPAEPAELRADLERELEAMLNLMEGVGSVKVFITYDRGPEQVVAYNETREERTGAGASGETARSAGPPFERRINRQVVLVRDADGRRELPVVLVERYPAIRGVMVVADGARHPAVRLAIQRAVATSLGVAAHRVMVQPKRR